MTARLDRILKLLAAARKVSVIELAEELEVSPATIRQDLTALENEGLLRRNHGGAELRETDDISRRMAINYDEKVKIAQRAAGFVKEGDTIFMESGSINALLARELASFKGVTVITSNAFIARSVDQARGCGVVLLGGVFQRESESLVGKLAIACVDLLNFNRVFLGVDGFTAETGFTGRDMMRAEIVNHVVSKGREIFVLSDSSKFGQVHVSRYCSLEDADHVITDSGLAERYRAELSGSTDLILT